MPERTDCEFNASFKLSANYGDLKRDANHWEKGDHSGARFDLCTVYGHMDYRSLVDELLGFLASAKAQILLLPGARCGFWFGGCGFLFVGCGFSFRGCESGWKVVGPRRTTEG